MTSSCCQGGFCELILPNNNQSNPLSNKATLSKREKRLQKSYQREQSIKLLKWVLTTQEYETLDETGDLIRLRSCVNTTKQQTKSSSQQLQGESSSEKSSIKKKNEKEGEGYWINGQDVKLAKIEHRPDLARLAFAEYQSSIGGSGDDGVECTSAGVCNSYGGPKHVIEPNSQNRNDGDVIVCGVCFNVYTLLSQARDLLASYDSDKAVVDEKIADENAEQCEESNNEPPEESHTSESLDNVEETTSTNNLKRASSEGPNSSQWANKNEQITSAKSFHGPISPTQQNKRSSSAKSNRKARRKKREMEENSKIHILVAESDENTNKLAKRLLEKKGYKVDSVSNGIDCFKALESSSTTYSVLLVNENLSGRDDAVSIGAWIRQNETTLNAQVKMRILVMVRNNILSINYHAYEETDVDGFLPMPLEGSKLIPSVKKAVSSYLESERLVEEERLRIKQIADANVSAVEKSEDAAAAAKSKEQQKQKRKKAKSSRSKKQAISGQLSSNQLKKKEPVAYESEFQYDENTKFPYAILENCSAESTTPTTGEETKPWCNLIVCQDVFDTFEKFKIFFLPMVSRYAGMKILLWNYPGQAFTSFSEDANLNNKYHADCLAKLLDHLKDNEKGKFNVDDRFFMLAHGSGASIATYFAATQRLTSLKGIVLVNGLSHVDSHYASVFHDCRNVFSCSPESRPDLPVYFYARFLFSPSYLSKTSSSLALNVYTAVHNPITLTGRKRLCQGVLNHIDTRPLLKDIASPIISIHGENATLVRAVHSSEFLNGRRSCSTIPQALRGGNRTAIVMMKGGHELFQEKKYHISLLVEQILTGFHDKVRVVHQHQHNHSTTSAAPPPSQPLKELNVQSNNNNLAASEPAANFRQPTKKFEDKFIDQVVKEGRGEGRASWDKYQDEIMTDTSPSKNNTNAQQKETQKATSPTATPKKEFDPNDYPEVKEYMAWRIKRHKKRLAALDRSARIIQCALRCFMAKTMMNRVRKQIAATVIQSYARGIFGRNIYQMKKKELWAAMFVQRAIRGHKGRCTSYNKRMERRAQMNVARMMRGISARRRFRAILIKREKSATRIQSIWRMHTAIVLKKYHGSRRAASTAIQRVYRGRLGRRKATLERDKYIFSRSQNSGIEMGRQMLAEHKLHATKLQSEISLLNQQKDKMEKQIEFHLTEISNFESNVSELEKKMHHLSKVERQSLGVLDSTKEHEVREEKRRMDEEFSETLVKISDRKEKLEKLEQTFEKLLRDRQEKFGQLKNLEGKLAVLLDAQDTALEGIRRKQDERIEDVAASPQHHPISTSHNNHGHRPPMASPSTHHQPATRQVPGNNNQQQQYYSGGPTEKDKMQAAQLIDSTETMMKFGFMSMSLTYFSSLNMMRAMQKVAMNDTLTNNGSPSADGGAHQYPNPANGGGGPQMMPTRSTPLGGKNSAVSVESWSVNDVSRWLTSISLSQYQSSFKEGAVDGSFLCELTDDDLRNTLGVEHRLHRKKILFSIRCLKNYAEAQATAFAQQQQQPPTTHTPQNVNVNQPQHNSTSGGGRSVASVMSPNSTIYDENNSNMNMPESMNHRGSSYSSNHDRQQQSQYHESPMSRSPPEAARSNSILDMMTPSRPETNKSSVLNFEQLRGWVRHQKHERLREALEHVSDSPFHTRHIRIQFIEDIGTAYTDQFDREPFNLNRVDNHGNTLMHIAAQTGNIRIGKLLLRKGANPNHQNKQGQTPGHFAVAYHFFKFASWLFDERGGGGDDLLTNMFGLGPYDGLSPGDE